MNFITTEALKSKQMEVPVITHMYDPLSGRHDGTITSRAPIVVQGRHLDALGWGKVKLCIVPAVEYGKAIDVPCVHVFSDTKVIVSLPALPTGEYFPAVRMVQEEGEEQPVYIFPVSWVVRGTPL